MPGSIGLGGIVRGGSEWSRTSSLRRIPPIPQSATSPPARGPSFCMDAKRAARYDTSRRPDIRTERYTVAGAGGFPLSSHQRQTLNAKPSRGRDELCSRNQLRPNLFFPANLHRVALSLLESLSRDRHREALHKKGEER